MNTAAPILGALVGAARPVSAGLNLCCVRLVHSKKHLTKQGDETRCGHCDSQLTVNVLGAWDRSARRDIS